MEKDGSTILFREFPKAISSSFNPNTFRSQFSNRSFIILAEASDIQYPPHWGVLSVKCAFKGTEYYESRNGFYAVNDSNFLVFNEGTYRSSYISSKTIVESFSISFSPERVRNFMSSLFSSPDRILDDPFHAGNNNLEFTEMLYPHDDLVSPLLYRIKALCEDWNTNRGEIEELLSLVLESLAQKQKRVWELMSKVGGVKISTQKELYKRLNRARDYIFSRFRENITTQEVANVACLNQYYFLREFKKLFHYTPHQYLQTLRLKEAERMLSSTDKMITEICNEVGYSDLASFSKLFKRHYNYSPSQRRIIIPEQFGTQC